MSTNLTKFTIHDLWGEKTVSLKFDNSKLILVGENGSGKTTILRIMYETLACRWSLLSVEDFSKIDLEFEDNSTVSISKDRLGSAKELFVDLDSPLFREIPMPIRRNLVERANISGRDISYDQIIEMMDEYDYRDKEIYGQLKEKVESVETNALSEYSALIKEKIGCSIIYLPTYRRVEKRIRYVNEKDYRHRPTYGTYRFTAKAFKDEQAIEIAKTGMDDVDFFIQIALDDIHRKFDISASRLNYECFKGILNKTSDNVAYDKAILSDVEIEKVFGSITKDILSPEETTQIKQQLISIQKMAPHDQQTYDKIVYYFYSMLHDRLLKLKENEKVILSFFNACNEYLGNKKFVYNEADYSYNIVVSDGITERKIDLEHLSSGEKQVVSIFSYLYLSPLDKSIILIDEPELSLSVPWQKKFLLDISKGTQCAGLISVTHSPFVFDNELRRYAHALEEFII